MEEEKKVGEKRKRAEEVADMMVGLMTRESFLELFSLGTCL
ncbi:unnamed protein product [Brassica rapa subsp. trilocularis]